MTSTPICEIFGSVLNIFYILLCGWRVIISSISMAPWNMSCNLITLSN
uniref:Uncharacterized protein n=1 Tax=Rhizophora mucronata TaxID=61149 RepID=A0A2P2JI23_RHIMU